MVGGCEAEIITGDNWPHGLFTASLCKQTNVYRTRICIISNQQKTWLSEAELIGRVCVVFSSLVVCSSERGVPEVPTIICGKEKRNRREYVRRRSSYREPAKYSAAQPAAATEQRHSSK